MMARLVFLLVFIAGRGAAREHDPEPLALEVRDRTVLMEDSQAPVVFRVYAGGDRIDEGRFVRVSGWQIQIFDGNTKVSFLQGRGYPPEEELHWWGKDVKGRQLANGFYLVRLAWRDTQGRTQFTPFLIFSLHTPLGIVRWVHRNSALFLE